MFVLCGVVKHVPITAHSHARRRVSRVLRVTSHDASERARESLLWIRECFDSWTRDELSALGFDKMPVDFGPWDAPNVLPNVEFNQQRALALADRVAYMGNFRPCLQPLGPEEFVSEQLSSGCVLCTLRREMFCIIG